MKLKICGITNKEDALNAVSMGVDAIGFIFYKNSPRYITPDSVQEITMFLPPYVTTVGVFVDQDKDEINRIADHCQLDHIKLHGNESPTFCLSLNRRVYKAFRIGALEDIEEIPKYLGSVSAVLLDTKIKDIAGGTGKTFDWGLALKAKDFEVPLILSGGINPNNAKRAITIVNPYALDVSSGVEKEPGIKDYNLIRDLMTAIRS